MSVRCRAKLAMYVWRRAWTSNTREELTRRQAPAHGPDGDNDPQGAPVGVRNAMIAGADRTPEHYRRTNPPLLPPLPSPHGPCSASG